MGGAESEERRRVKDDGQRDERGVRDERTAQVRVKDGRKNSLFD